MTELPLVRALRIPVTDTFHGVDVTEDYRWLEDASSEEAIAWTEAQQQRTRAYFGAFLFDQLGLGYRPVAPA